MKILNNFYTKISLNSFAILSIVYSFVMCSFYWGNHDWHYIKNGVSLLSGFFEARYSMHLFSMLLMGGHILPILTVLFWLLGIVFLGVVSGSYLGFEKRSKDFLIFVLLVGLFPYGSIVLYYLFIAVPLNLWAIFGVLLLFLNEKPFSFFNFFFGSLGYMLLLGSYPPNVAFVLVLFIGKRIIEVVINKESFRDVVLKSLYFIGQLGVGYVLFKGIIWGLVSNKFLDLQMYNVKIDDISVIFRKIPIELMNSVKNLFLLKSELGLSGCAFLVITIFGGFARAIIKAKNKILVFLLLLGMFLASRFMFIVSSSGIASYRGGYWGILGLVVVSLVFLNLKTDRWFRNCMYIFDVFFLVVFIHTNFEMQKTMNFIFKSEANFHERLKARVEDNNEFNNTYSYMSLSLGMADYSKHFCKNGCDGFNNEVLSSTTMNMDLIPLLFFDDEYVVDTKLGAWVNNIWTISDGKYFRARGKESIVNKVDVLKMKDWLYLKSKVWPSIDSVYVDGRIIIVMLDDDKKYVYGKEILDLLNF